MHRERELKANEEGVVKGGIVKARKEVVKEARLIKLHNIKADVILETIVEKGMRGYQPCEQDASPLSFD